MQFHPIDYRRERDRVHAKARIEGHVFLASVDLPPFVQDDPARYASAILAAEKKAGQAVVDLVVQVFPQSTPVWRDA